MAVHPALVPPRLVPSHPAAGGLPLHRWPHQRVPHGSPDPETASPPRPAADDSVTGSRGAALASFPIGRRRAARVPKFAQCPPDFKNVQLRRARREATAAIRPTFRRVAPRQTPQGFSTELATSASRARSRVRAPTGRLSKLHLDALRETRRRRRGPLFGKVAQNSLEYRHLRLARAGR